MKKFSSILYLSLGMIFFNFSNAEAKCNFILKLGQKFNKSHESRWGILNEDPTSYAEHDIYANEICKSDDFNDNFKVRHIFVQKKLMAIQFYVDNYFDNSATESMKLMNYAKRIYGNFDTGPNPKLFNSYKLWKKNNKIVVYKRFLAEGIWDEEIFITNNELKEELALYRSRLEQGFIDPKVN